MIFCGFLNVHFRVHFKASIGVYFISNGFLCSKLEEENPGKTRQINTVLFKLKQFEKN